MKYNLKNNKLLVNLLLSKSKEELDLLDIDLMDADTDFIERQLFYHLLLSGQDNILDYLASNKQFMLEQLNKAPLAWLSNLIKLKIKTHYYAECDEYADYVKKENIEKIKLTLDRMVDLIDKRALFEILEKGTRYDSFNIKLEPASLDKDIIDVLGNEQYIDLILSGVKRIFSEEALPHTPAFNLLAHHKVGKSFYSKYNRIYIHDFTKIATAIFQKGLFLNKKSLTYILEAAVNADLDEEDSKKSLFKILDFYFDKKSSEEQNFYFVNLLQKINRIEKISSSHLEQILKYKNENFLLNNDTHYKSLINSLFVEGLLDEQNKERILDKINQLIRADNGDNVLIFFLHNIDSTKKTDFLEKIDFNISKKYILRNVINLLIHKTYQEQTKKNQTNKTLPQKKEGVEMWEKIKEKIILNNQIDVAFFHNAKDKLNLWDNTRFEAFCVDFLTTKTNLKKEFKI